MKNLYDKLKEYFEKNRNNPEQIKKDWDSTKDVDNIDSPKIEEFMKKDERGNYIHPPHFIENYIGFDYAISILQSRLKTIVTNYHNPAGNETSDLFKIRTQSLEKAIEHLKSNKQLTSTKPVPELTFREAHAEYKLLKNLINTYGNDVPEMFVNRFHQIIDNLTRHRNVGNYYK